MFINNSKNSQPPRNMLQEVGCELYLPYLMAEGKSAHCFVVSNLVSLSKCLPFSNQSIFNSSRIYKMQLLSTGIICPILIASQLKIDLLAILQKSLDRAIFLYNFTCEVR